MQQNKALFFGIIGLAMVIVIAVLLVGFLMPQQFELPIGQEKTTLRLVAAPALKSWLDQSARAFNQSQSNTQVEIIEANGLIPTSQLQAQPARAAWLAEAAFVADLAANSGLKFNSGRSVAAAPLAWGAFKDKQDMFAQKYGGLTWDGMHAKAVSPEDRLTVVIASPQNSTEGLAALISAAAAYLKKDSLTGADIAQAEGWLSETLVENIAIPARPAEAFAGTMGRSIGDAGLLSLTAWRSVGLDKKADFAITPVQPGLTLDFPLLIHADATPAEQEAARAFGDFLLQENQQNALVAFGFDRAGAGPGGVKADAAAVLALQRWAERSLK
jgi:hypothetical protein